MSRKVLFLPCAARWLSQMLESEFQFHLELNPLYPITVCTLFTPCTSAIRVAYCFTQKNMSFFSFKKKTFGQTWSMLLNSVQNKEVSFQVPVCWMAKTRKQGNNKPTRVRDRGRGGGGGGERGGGGGRERTYLNTATSLLPFPPDRIVMAD